MMSVRPPIRRRRVAFATGPGATGAVRPTAWTFRAADAEALAFPDASFDVAHSTFGVMFTPDQERAAAELVRVVRPGGRIGLASWTPESFIGELFKTVGRYLPPPAGLRPPSLWGTEARLRELFPGCPITPPTEVFACRCRSVDRWLEVFKTWYGPTNRAFAALDAERGAALVAGAHTVELDLARTEASDRFAERRQGPASRLVPAWVEELPAARRAAPGSSRLRQTAVREAPAGSLVTSWEPC